jgi:hypothetical protein
MLQPTRDDPKCPGLAPAVVVSYFTEIESTTPGNTFGGASGYFSDLDHVITAKHLIDGIERDLSNEWVIINRSMRPYGLVVQDPRTSLSWQATGHSPLPGTDLCVLHVVPNLFDQADARSYSEWAARFQAPAHRITPICLGESVRIVGFTEIDYTLEYDETAEGGNRSLRCAPFGLYGEDTVSSVNPTGIRQFNFPCFSLENLQAVGGMSGGPALDVQGHIAGVVSSSIEHGESTIIDWPGTFRMLQLESPSTFYSLPCLCLGARFAPIRLEAL